uniref:DYW domain-containing protein n=2 Tax=Oryza TaxID=4527 RepID=A0A0E0GGK8_ORYNI
MNNLIKKVEKLGQGAPPLLHHSEKLAIAYGLISGAVPSGKMLRIVRNWRICVHCHQFFKYASMVIQVIVVRHFT